MRAALAVEQVARAAQPEPQATQAAREAVRAATALLNRPAAKAVRLAILLLNRPAVRAKIALIPQGRELGLVLRPGAYASDVFPVAVTARLAVDQDFKSRVLVRLHRPQSSSASRLWDVGESGRPRCCDRASRGLAPPLGVTEKGGATHLSGSETFGSRQ